MSGRLSNGGIENARHEETDLIFLARILTVNCSDYGGDYDSDTTDQTGGGL